jgi:hypothetical protein
LIFFTFSFQGEHFGYYAAAALFVVPTITTLVNSQFYHQMFRLGFHVINHSNSSSWPCFSITVIWGDKTSALSQLPFPGEDGFSGSGLPQESSPLKLCKANKVCGRNSDSDAGERLENVSR